MTPVNRPNPVPTLPAALSALVRRRFALSVRTPRELFVPLLTPVLFAIVIAPALASIGPKIPGLDYMSYAAVGTAVLLIPLNCMFAGIGVIVDRETGARRDLLAAPIRRSVIVFANLVVAFAVTALQVVAAARRRGTAGREPRRVGVRRCVVRRGGCIARHRHLRTRRDRRQPHAVGRGVHRRRSRTGDRAVLLQWRLVPDHRDAAGLAGVARLLPSTHALALMRYGLLGGNASGLHDIWGMSNATVMAALSLGVVALFAIVLTLAALRSFRRASVS